MLCRTQNTEPVAVSTCPSAGIWNIRLREGHCNAPPHLYCIVTVLRTRSVDIWFRRPRNDPLLTVVKPSNA